MPIAPQVQAQLDAALALLKPGTRYVPPQPAKPTVREPVKEAVPQVERIPINPAPKMRDAAHAPQPKPSAMARAADLARVKRLPLEFLHELGLKDVPNGVSIEYRLMDGSLAPRQRIRLSPAGKKNRSVWDKNSGAIVPYGLDRLREAYDAGFLVLVEGESDCWTLWHQGYPALGIPGATMASTLRPEYFNDEIAKVYFVQEPGDAGKVFVQQLTARLRDPAFAWKGDIFVVSLGAVKDPSDLHVQNPSAFNAAFNAACDYAIAVDRAAQAKPTAPSAIMRPFSEIKPETLRWLWPGRIPLGKLILYVGDPGLGKSLTTIDVAARVSRGMPFPDGEACEPGAVVMANAEDDPSDTIRPRLDVAGADVSRVHILEGMRVTLTDNSSVERAFDLETGIPTLEDALARIGGVRLVIIDPISAYLGGADSNTNAEVRGILAPLAALAAKHGVAILCVTHLRKSAGPAVHRAIASIAFTAAARAVWAVASDPSDVDRRLMLPVKQNLGPNIGGLAFRVEAQNGIPHLSWETGAVNLDANEVLKVEDCEDHSEHKEAEQWLREYLADGPVGASDVLRAASAVGVKRTTLWRAASSLAVVKHKLGGRGAGWEWSIQDSKNPDPIYTHVDSLDSLTKQQETKLDTSAKNSKNPRFQDIGAVESLPLLTQNGGEEDEEVRL